MPRNSSTSSVYSTRTLGPPKLTRARSYPPVLEMLESNTNKALFAEYADDVPRHLAQLEAANGISVQLIDMQPEIKWYMRPYLLDFLSETHYSLRLQPQTYFLAWSIIDRYCSKRVVFKKHYQLVGCTALLIAAKYEDKKSRVPTLQDLVHLTRQTYDETMFMQMERHILTTLEWSLGQPTYEECLQLAISTSVDFNQLTPVKKHRPNGESMLTSLTEMGRFFCEIALYDKSFLHFPVSLVAIAANSLASQMLDIPSTAARLQHIIAHFYSQSARDSYTHDDEFFFEDEENCAPRVTGAFLSGFNEDALLSIKKITLLFMTSLTSVSEFVQRKYQELGVCQVINQYIHRNAFSLKPVLETTHDALMDVDLSSLEYNQLNYISDILLGLSFIQPQTIVQTPLTPPSTVTSRYSSVNSCSDLPSSAVTPCTANSPFFSNFSSPSHVPPYSFANNSTDSSIGQMVGKDYSIRAPPAVREPFAALPPMVAARDFPSSSPLAQRSCW